jgi:hypothetical protein
MRLSMITLGILLVIGCATQTPSPAASPAPAKDGSHPVGTKLLRDVDASPRTFEVGKNEGHGLGDFSVRVAGKALWPPAGDGCPDLIACCTDLTAREGEMALACQFAVGRDGACPAAKETVRQIAGEHGLELPPTCSR